MKRFNSVTTSPILAIIGIISLCFVTTASAQTEAHPWDVNGDGIVDIDDLMFVGSHFGDSSVTSADVNGDGLVDIVDLVLVGVHFGEEYEPTMPGADEIIGSDGAPMVLIPAGEFMMGEHHGDGRSDERPVHPVYLDAFYIDKYEVTNAQYAQFLNEYGKNTDPAGHTLLYIGSPWCLIENVGGTYRPKAGYETHPVIEVSWYGAAAYAQHYGKRLPTEAEWERAARGTYVGEGEYKTYVWGDEWPPPEGAGNFYSQYIDGYHDDYEQIAPVGSFDPNGYGLHDMAGNVWEWCQDWYDSGYYSTSPRNNPTGPTSGGSRVLRGGSWPDSDWSDLRVASRLYNYPDYSCLNVGFRCGASRGD